MYAMSLFSKPYIWKRNQQIHTALVYSLRRQHAISSPPENGTVRMGKAAKGQASRKQLETAGFAWPPSETQSTSTVVPTTACGLPAPLSGRQLEWWFKDE